MVQRPRLTGAEARSAKGTAVGHQNTEGMSCSSVRVELTVRLVTGAKAVELII